MTSSPLPAARAMHLSAPLTVIRKEANHCKLYFLLLEMLTDRAYVPWFVEHQWVMRELLERASQGQRAEGESEKKIPSRQ